MGFFIDDSSWFDTHDIFLRKGSLIVNYIIDKIERDSSYAQVLRRLLRYMTINPLGAKSLDYSNNEIIQEDLKDSLLNYSYEGTLVKHIDDNGKVIKSKSEPCLYNGMFSQDMKIIDQCFVFIHNYRNKPIKKDNGLIYVRIDIIIPDKYDNILDIDSGLTVKRGQVIAFLIDDLINKKEIKDEFYADYLGNLSLNLLDNSNTRLTKTSDGVVYSLIYALDTPKGEIMNGNI